MMDRHARILIIESLDHFDCVEKIDVMQKKFSVWNVSDVDESPA